MDNNQLGLDEAFALGDLDQFYKRSKEKIAAKISGRKFAGFEAEDVSQECLIKIHKAIPKYDASKAKIGTFIDTIIQNTLKDSFKKAGSNTNLSVVNAKSLNDESVPTKFVLEGAEDVPFEIGTDDGGYVMFEVVTDLMSNLGLTDREKEVFKLRASGYENCEIADILGVSRVRISQIWSRIVDKYRSAD